jgi:GNAT superfamily N-acetyltransferase
VAFLPSCRRKATLLPRGVVPAGRIVRDVIALRVVSFDHPDAVRLTEEVQAVYRERYGGEDATPMDPREFAPPRGLFLVGYGGDGAAVACGGWRVRGGPEDPSLPPGDAEVKRMYVRTAYRGRGYARAVLAELERTAAAAGRRRIVLETGTLQPEAIGLYASAGYEPIPPFGAYRDSPHSRYYAKPLFVAPPADLAPVVP